jgi:WD repeat-containing protein 61
MTELPGYAGAIHPEGKCWAWSGRSSKLGIRQISSLGAKNGNGNGESNGEASRGPLAGTGKVVDTGKGKFGMDVKFVSYHV